MLTAEAHVDTELASRHLVQFCRHASHMVESPLDQRPGHGPGHRRPHQGPGHRAPGHSGGHRPAEMANLEWSDTYAVASFGWGRCTLQATPRTLEVRAEASDEEGLRRIQDGVGRRLETIGSRDNLKVTWEAPLILTSVQSEGAASPAGRAGHGRGILGTIGMGAAAGAFILHHALGLGLGLAGGAILASQQGLGSGVRVGAEIVLALVVLKFVAMAVNMLILRRLGRSLPFDRMPPWAARPLRWVFG